MIRATDTRQLHMQNLLHVKCRTGLNPKTVKLVRAAASYHATKPKNTRESVATKISNATQLLVFYPYKATTQSTALIPL